MLNSPTQRWPFSLTSRLARDLTDPRLKELYQCLVTRLRCRILGTLLRDLCIQLSTVDSAGFGSPSLNFQGVDFNVPDQGTFEERVSQATP